jgi:hypothetical protein
MQPSPELGLHLQHLTRRTFLGQSARGIGGIALGAMLAQDRARAAAAVSPAPPLSVPPSSARASGAAGLPHFAPKAKRVLCLFQSGGLSHVDLFDDKPMLHKHAGLEIPASVKGSQRLTGMTSNQSAYPVVPPLRGGKRCGAHGTWISDLLPHHQTIADDICLVKSLHTEAINHDPAITYMNTGNQQPGYASMGAWVSYGLGSENANLPAFIAMVSQGTGKNPGQPIFSRLWGSGFLPASHQGVGLRPGANPVLYLEQSARRGPRPAARAARRSRAAQPSRAAELGDPETSPASTPTRWRFACRCRCPELTDLRGESAATLAAYGPRCASPAPTPPTACSRAACSNATCVSCSSSTAAGTSTSRLRGSCPTSAATSTSPPPRS